MVYSWLAQIVNQIASCIFDHVIEFVKTQHKWHRIGCGDLPSSVAFIADEFLARAESQERATQPFCKRGLQSYLRRISPAGLSLARTTPPLVFQMSELNPRSVIGPDSSRKTKGEPDGLKSELCRTRGRWSRATRASPQYGTMSQIEQRSRVRATHPLPRPHACAHCHGETNVRVRWQ